MKRLKNILLEGRIEDAQRHFEDSVGSWPVAEPGNPAGVGAQTNLDGVLKHFTQNDPSGNNKYLMWMVKMYLNPEERGTSPNDISSVVQRFHKNVGRLSTALIINMDIFDPSSRIATSPKNLDSYGDISQVERVMDEVDSIQTKKEKETQAKSGVDKLYEDERWLLVKPNTYEGSCYYGSSTKWCTSSKTTTTHFEDYSKRGNLYYIIDKSHQLGDYYKIALFKEWDGNEEWYDRADDSLNQGTINAIRSMVPQDLIKALDNSYRNTKPPEQETMFYTLDEFQNKLTEYIKSKPSLQTITTESGIWKWESDIMNQTWTWRNSKDNEELSLQATPFWDGLDGIPFDSYSDDDEFGNFHDTLLAPEVWEYNEYIGKNEFLSKTNTDMGVKLFLTFMYLPKLREVLTDDFFKQQVNRDYTIWTSSNPVSTYTFKWPPKSGSMTQLFTDYIKQNPGSSPNDFYEEVYGKPRPRGHNNMFFSSIKDSGIVKMEREGRRFVYSLGPNYKMWTRGNLLRSGRRNMNVGYY